MFPLKALRKQNTTPYVTFGLIAVNVLVFAWQLTLSQSQLGSVFMNAALVPCEASRSVFSPETWLDSFRTMFLHGGWLHLVGNMVFLLIFGPHIEEYFGKVKYLLFYIAAGTTANLLHTAINWNVCIPSIGASGAIMGLMGSFFLLYPATRIRVVAFFFRVPVGTVDTQAFYLLAAYFVFDFINGLGALGVSNTATGGVAVWAHIGGFLGGLLLTFIAIIFKPPPPVDEFEYLDH